ncbi:MAG: MFS transporter [Steroidobacteraceae bacterium]
MSSLRAESRLIALIVASAFFLQGLDSAIINTSLPQMAASLHVATLDMSIGITIYMLTAAAFVPMSGWLADRFGARDIFMAAILVFTIASLGCALAHTLWQFSIARAVQGLGGALMTPVGRMVVLRNTEKNQLLQATALITWPALAAPVVGPVIGGFLTTYFSWRWNFLMNIPIGMLGIWLAWHFIPTAREAAPNALDRLGLALSSTALSLTLFGLESFAHDDLTSGMPMVLTLTGLVAGYLAVRHFHRTANPLLSLSSLQVQTYRVSNLSAGAFFRISSSAMPFLLPLLFQIGFGMSALAAGSWMLVYFFGNLGMKPITTPILKRFGFRRILLVNGCITALCIAGYGLLTPQSPNSFIIIVLLLSGLTRSMQFTALNTLAFADVTIVQRSSSSTLASMITQITAVLGVALGAFLLKSMQAISTRSHSTLADFQITFSVIGVMVLLTTLLFLRLPHDAGAEVSGHQV